MFINAEINADFLIEGETCVKRTIYSIPGDRLILRKEYCENIREIC